MTTGEPCPACLLGIGLETMDPAEPSVPASKWTPPGLEELAGRFPELELLELLGRGGMGAVYKARQTALNREVAVKILPPEIGEKATFAERFVREARALARLNHPHIVTVFDFGERDGLYFFIMEFVDGVNLRQLLDTARISSREALAIVPQICDALQCAHDQGIVHRDIKPENILLDRQGRVKIADFGLAKLMGTGAESGGDGGVPLSDSGTRTLAAVGTPAYMAPEQMDHPGEVDHRADIYALGVVFYQMLTGELPGKKLEPPSRRDLQIDIRLDEVVLRALEQKPQRRYAQVSALKARVETVTATLQTPDLPTPRSAQPVRWMRVAGWLLAVALLALLGFSGLKMVVPLGSGSTQTLAQQPHKLRSLPVGRVIEVGVGEPLLPWAWQELGRRARAGRLVAADGDQLMDGLTTWLKRDYPDGYPDPLHWMDNMLDTLHAENLLSEEQTIRFQTAFQGSPRIETLPRLRESDKSLSIRVKWRNIWHKELMGMVLLNELRTVTLDGQAVTLRNTPYPRNWNDCHRELVLPHLLPGKHVVRCTIESGLLLKSDLVGMDAKAKAMDWPPAKRRWIRTCAAEFMVYPDDVEVVTLVHDRAMNPAAKHGLGIKVAAVQSIQEGTAAKATVVFDLGDGMPIPISFDVSLQIDGSTYACGGLWAHSREGRMSSSSLERHAEIPRPDADTKTVDVHLVPNPDWVDRRAGLDRIWGKEIVFSQVPLIRYDLPRSP